MPATPIPRDVEGGLRIIAREHGLTQTLEERLVELACGLAYLEIADRRSITVNTVKTQVKTILSLMNLGSRREIENAARAAAKRAENGATLETIAAFLALRFE